MRNDSKKYIIMMKGEKNGKKKILVADDNRNIIELVKMEFEILDYDVVTAYDGEDALKR